MNLQNRETPDLGNQHHSGSFLTQTRKSYPDLGKNERVTEIREIGCRFNRSGAVDLKRRFDKGQADARSQPGRVTDAVVNERTSYYSDHLRQPDYLSRTK